MDDELMLLLKGKSDDYLNSLIAKKILDKVSNKIAGLSESEKNRLIAALLLKEYELPDDLKEIMSVHIDSILTETLAKEIKPQVEVPKQPGEVGARVVNKKKAEGESRRERKRAREGRKEQSDTLRLSQLL